MAFLLINPADTARKLFVLGDPQRVTHDPAAGGEAEPGVDDYFQPGGVDSYLRPGGVDTYKRPA